MIKFISQQSTLEKLLHMAVVKAVGRIGLVQSAADYIAFVWQGSLHNPGLVYRHIDNLRGKNLDDGHDLYPLIPFMEGAIRLVLTSEAIDNVEELVDQIMVSVEDLLLESSLLTQHAVELGMSRCFGQARQLKPDVKELATW